MTNPIPTSETAQTIAPIILAIKEKAKDDNTKTNHRITHAPWAIENPKNLAAIAVETTTLLEPATNA